MGTMSKTLLAVLVGILVGGAAYVMAAPADKSSFTATPAAATTSTTSTVDVSGPCDEAEHANDPRCAGPQRPEDNGQNNQVDDGQVGQNDGPGHDVGDDNPGEPTATAARAPRTRVPAARTAMMARATTSSDDHGGHGADDGPGHDVGDDHGGDSGNSGSGSSGSGSSGSGSSGSSHSGGSTTTRTERIRAPRLRHVEDRCGAAGRISGRRPQAVSPATPSIRSL